MIGRLWQRLWVCPRRRGDPAEITCRAFHRFIVDYLDGDLPRVERAEFERHLAVCPDCRHYLEGYRQTVHLVRLAAGDQGVPEAVPETLVRAVVTAQRSRPSAVPPGGAAS